MDQKVTYHVEVKRLDEGNYGAHAYANAIITHVEIAAAGDPLAFVREKVHEALDVALDEVGPPNG